MFMLLLQQRRDLTVKYLMTLVSIENYELIRSDRPRLQNRKGGGVCVYTKSNIT